jgi:hypothetical protein
MEHVLVELPLKNAGGKIRTLPCVLRTLEKNKALPRYARNTSNVSHNSFVFHAPQHMPCM